MDKIFYNWIKSSPNKNNDKKSLNDTNLWTNLCDSKLKKLEKEHLQFKRHVTVSNVFLNLIILHRGGNLKKKKIMNTIK